MYISRVQLNSLNRRVMRDLKHVGCYHGWIEDSFPEERLQPKEESNRKLWRIDQINNKQYLLIVSNNKPDLKKLEKYGVKGSASTKNYDAFLASLQEGMHAKFRVKLNAVKSLSDRTTHPKRGKVVVVTFKDLPSFFMECANANGFSINPEQIRITTSKELFQHYGEDKMSHVHMTLAAATFDGILTITDLEKFKKALMCGMGKKKAYGFGMLTVIPCK